MSQVFQPLFIPPSVLRIFLQAILLGFNPFAQKTVRLFQAGFTMQEDIVLADVHEADFQGYVVTPDISLINPFFDDAGQLVMLGPNIGFQASGPARPNIIGGWFLTDAADTGFVWGQYLPRPTGMGKAGDTIVVQPYFLWTAQKPGAPPF